MKFTSIFTTALLAANVIASPLASPEPHQLSKRDAPAVVAAVKVLSDDMVALNVTLNSYEGGLGSAITALKIKAQTDTVKKATEAVTEAADASAKFTNKGAGEVANSLLALQPNINSVLDNIVSKKGAFEEALLGFISLTWLVKSDLEDLKDLSADLGEAVIKKLTPQYAALAPVLNKQIAKKFAEAIKAYE
ncbi:hypothetical protein FQN54_007249 [Arachnomyces sp. PD_36]|nr:hypothetical protein FQN54_007249 [Arachnomyces sp. PD_36]